MRLGVGRGGLLRRGGARCLSALGMVGGAVDVSMATALESRVDQPELKQRGAKITARGLLFES